MVCLRAIQIPALVRRLGQELAMSNFVQQGQRELDADFDGPCGPGFIALLEAFRATGGTARGEILGRLLEDHRIGDAVRLAKLIYTGQAFGCEWRDSLWIPMFQFDANDLVLKASVQSVRAELPSLWSGWQVASWFAAPNARLDGHTPADRLDSDLEGVVQAAAALSSVDEFALLAARRAHEEARHV